MGSEVFWRFDAQRIVTWTFLLLFCRLNVNVEKPRMILCFPTRSLPEFLSLTTSSQRVWFYFWVRSISFRDLLTRDRHSRGQGIHSAICAICASSCMSQKIVTIYVWWIRRHARRCASRWMCLHDTLAACAPQDLNFNKLDVSSFLFCQDSRC